MGPGLQRTHLAPIKRKKAMAETQKMNFWKLFKSKFKIHCLDITKVSHHDVPTMQYDGSSKGYQAKYKQVSI